MQMIDPRLKMGQFTHMTVAMKMNVVQQARSQFHHYDHEWDQLMQSLDVRGQHPLAKILFELMKPSFDAINEQSIQLVVQ